MVESGDEAITAAGWRFYDVSTRSCFLQQLGAARTPQFEPALPHDIVEITHRSVQKIRAVCFNRPCYGWNYLGALVSLPHRRFTAIGDSDNNRLQLTANSSIVTLSDGPGLRIGHERNIEHHLVDCFGHNCRHSLHPHSPDVGRTPSVRRCAYTSSEVCLRLPCQSDPEN